VSKRQLVETGARGRLLLWVADARLNILNIVKNEPILPPEVIQTIFILSKIINWARFFFF
jgi:hypothetical protein